MGCTEGEMGYIWSCGPRTRVGFYAVENKIRRAGTPGDQEAQQSRLPPNESQSRHKPGSLLCIRLYCLLQYLQSKAYSQVLVMADKDLELSNVGDMEEEVPCEEFESSLPLEVGFDSNRDRGEPFTFKLGQVIKGWDKGIITVKKEENALFTIPPDLAYDAANAPTVPPNATVQFDVELISWTNLVNVCNDGGILKQIVSQGEKYEKPKDLDEVTSNSFEL
eukprot:Gb_34258 [translate_table: standard]